MKATGKLIFKGIVSREAGQFTDNTGRNVQYDMCYILTVDEMQENGTFAERKLKVEKENTGLVAQLRELKPYTEIDLECNVKLFNNACRIIPVRLLNTNSNNK